MSKEWCRRWAKFGVHREGLGLRSWEITFSYSLSCNAGGGGGGKRRAITEGPWEFGGDLIVVDFDETKRLKDLVFTHFPVWVRVYNLPFGLMNVDTGRVIGNKIGKALEVDTDEDGSAVGGYLLVKVLMDARKALIGGVMMEGVAGEKENWCGVKYEFLPNFCYSCGVLGHVEECDDKVWKEEEQQFGDWLRVLPMKQRDVRGWSSEGGSSGGSFQHRSVVSWRKSGVEKGGSSGVGGKSASRDDPELRDDAESPGKGHPKIRMGGAPKKLTFVGDGSSGSLTEERGHKKLLEITAPSEPQLVPTTGEVASGLDGEDARGKEHSTMQVPVGGGVKDKVCMNVDIQGSISLESNVG